MTSNEKSAEILDMEDARRRREHAEAAQFRDAGALLKSVRENLGYSIAEASSKTHIKERHLEAIEALDVSNLPARPYAVGFVRAYADFLELDADKIVDFYKESAGFDAAPRVEPEKFEHAERAEAADKPELSLLAVVAILAFMLWCAWQITLPREVRQLGPDDGAAALGEAAPTPALPTPPPPTPENVVDAVLIERVEPIYPMGCLTAAAPTETVVVALTVTVQGRVAGERVASATNPCFEEAALISVRRWKFEPRTVDGAPRPAHDQRFELAFQRPL